MIDGNIERLLPAWFVYETVIALSADDGWRRVEHRASIRKGYRETIILQSEEHHRPTKFTLGAFGCEGHWFVRIDITDPNPTWAVLDPETSKTYIITARPDRNLGRPLTYSLPTADLYTYPGEYVTSC